MGQQQLMCLARAALKKVPVLCLDEATAAMDPHTEAHVLEIIERLFTERTTFTIAHRCAGAMVWLWLGWLALPAYLLVLCLFLLVANVGAQWKGHHSAAACQSIHACQCPLLYSCAAACQSIHASQHTPSPSFNPRAPAFPAAGWTT